jgi:hypothetical protein
VDRSRRHQGWRETVGSLTAPCWVTFARWVITTDRLVAGAGGWTGSWLFGDPVGDHAASLGKLHQRAPPANWRNFVSAYATTAWGGECWAHYLHMRDAIDTARFQTVRRSTLTDTDSPLSH